MLDRCIACVTELTVERDAGLSCGDVLASPADPFPFV